MRMHVEAADEKRHQLLAQDLFAADEALRLGPREQSGDARPQDLELSQDVPGANESRMLAISGVQCPPRDATAGRTPRRDRDH